MTDGPVAVVAAGAGARGAYEAGALSVLIPWLHAQGRPPRIFVGTSAGAINATMFAAVAHLDPADGGSRVLDTWRTLTVRKVIAPPYLSLPFKTLPTYLGQLLGRRRAHVGSLLDTSPMRATAAEIFEPYRDILRDNIHGTTPAVDALAVVATDERNGTTVFVDQGAVRTYPLTTLTAGSITPRSRSPISTYWPRRRSPSCSRR